MLPVMLRRRDDGRHAPRQRTGCKVWPRTHARLCGLTFSAATRTMNVAKKDSKRHRSTISSGMNRTLKEIHPGVTGIKGEPLRYYVASHSRLGISHVVDLSMNYGNGECSCENFQFTRLPVLLRGDIPSERTECRHIREAKRFLALYIIRKTMKNMKEKL